MQEQKIISEMRKHISAILGAEYLAGGGIRSAAVLAAGASAERLARFLRNIILVRVLAPDDFGIMAMIMAVVYGFKALSGVGVQQAIIQSRHGKNPEFLNAAWWFSMVLGFLVFIPFLLSSGTIAAIYQHPELKLMLQIVSVTVIMESLVSPRVYAQQKELKFVRSVILIQGAGVVNVIVAIAISYVVGNYWALIIAFLIESLCRLLFSFVLCPFVPRLKLDRGYATEIFRFARRIFGLPVLLLVFMQADIFFLGKYMTIAEVGVYSLTLALAQIPYMFFAAVVHPVILPVLAKIQSDEIRFRQGIVKISMVISIISSPAIFFLAIYSEQILTLTYGDLYSSAASSLIVLSFYYLIRIFSEVLAQAFMAMGRPNEYRNISLFRVIIILSLLYPLIKAFGFLGAAIAMALTTIVFWTLIIIRLEKKTRFVISGYLFGLLKGFAISLLVIIPGLLLLIFDIEADPLDISIGVATCLASWALAGILMFLRSNKFDQHQPESIAAG